MTLSNRSGIEVSLLSRGAAIRAIRVPTPDGVVDTVLGYPTAEAYLSDPYYMGATLGRYVNRIRGARCEVGGARIALDANDGEHCLHGGRQSLSARVWRLARFREQSEAVFVYTSPHGESGFPGTLDVSVRYALQSRALAILLTARSDRDTVVSLSNHAYFNLAGTDSVRNHSVRINADAYTPVDADVVPTGAIAPVADTVFDLRQPTRLADRLRGLTGGFDQNYVLNKDEGASVRFAGHRAPFAASAVSAESGVGLNVYTTQPGLQFYTGQHLGDPFVPFQGMCFEPQAFPDAPNVPGFPSTYLSAGETYRELIVYAFDVPGAALADPERSR